jgi:hypothetical protein
MTISHIGPFPDTHVIAYFPPNTITYEEPTIPAHLNIESRTETAALHLYCIHHTNSPISTQLHNHAFQAILDKLNIQQTQLLLAPPTPLPIQVNKCKIWNSLPYPPILTFPNSIPPLPTYQIPLTLKFPPCYNYYTDGSFNPPKQKTDGTWIPENAGYGIYNPLRNIHISARLPGLQNILCAELLAIHHTLQLILAQFPHEPAYIFTDCLNIIYLLLTQMQHPTYHNSHPDKTLLQSIIHMLTLHTQPITIAKVKAFHTSKEMSLLTNLPNKAPHYPTAYPVLSMNMPIQRHITYTKIHGPE